MATFKFKKYDGSTFTVESKTLVSAWSKMRSIYGNNVKNYFKYAGKSKTKRAKSKYRISGKLRGRAPITEYTNSHASVKEFLKMAKKKKMPHTLSVLNKRTNRFRKVVKWGW